MKKNLSVILLFVFCFFPSVYAQQEQKTTAAVMDLEAKEGVPKGTAAALSDYLRTQLFNTRKFTIVTREDMDQVFKEQELSGLSEDTSKACVVVAGQILAVRKMFSGTIGKKDNTYIITLKIIDVQTGRVDNTLEERCIKCEEDTVLESIKNIAYKIAGLKVPK